MTEKDPYMEKLNSIASNVSNWGWAIFLVVCFNTCGTDSKVRRVEKKIDKIEQELKVIKELL